MMQDNISRASRIKKRKVGEVSSKYGYQPERFDLDMQRHKERMDSVWSDLIRFAKDRGLTPDDLRYLLIRLYEEYLLARRD